MRLINTVALANDFVSGGEYYYEIDNLTDVFSIRSDNKQMQLSIGKADNYVRITSENADLIDVNLQSEPALLIHGNDYSFDVSIRTDEAIDEYINNRFGVKGSATSDVLIERNTDDVYVSSENTITEIETARWDSEGISNEQLPDSSEVEMLLDTSFILDVHKLIMKPGEEYMITPAKLPDECSPEDIVWSVDNDSVAQVDQDGTVRAIESGTAFVTANIPSLNLSKTVKVVVHSWVSGIQLNKNEIDLEIGKTEHLIATVLPDDAANKNVIWTSSDPEYVTVDETGNITAVKVTEEPVIITVRTEEGGFTADCQVTVHEPVNAETLKYGEGFRYLNVGQEKQLEVIPEPANASLIWQSDNESVLTVDSQGIVKAVSEGTATVTVSSGEKRLTFAVTVIPYTIEEWVKDYEHIVDLDNKTVKLKHYDFDYHSDENLEVYNRAIVNGEQFDVYLDYGLWWCRDYNGDYDVKKIDFPDGIVFPKNCYVMFCNLRALTSLNLGKCSTSNTVKMDEMFKNCTALETLDLSSFDTSNVTDMNSMFNNCRSLKSVDLSSFDTSNVVWMNSMFYECGALERLDLGHFNTSNVTDMGYMFAFCSALAELNLSSFDTSKVTRMLAMFESCKALPTVDVSQFDTSSVTDMGYMFAFCNELTELNLSSFDTSEVTSMRSMFADCKMITKLDLSTFDLSNVTNTSSFLNGANSLSELTGPAVYGNSTISLPRNMYFMKDGMITSAGTLSAESGSGIYFAADSSNINTDENIILDQSQLTIKPGKTAALTASISSPDNNQTVTWISTNPAAATVNSNGLVTGVSEGTATITASVSGCTATCTVTVIDPINIESVSLALKEKIEARFYVYVPDSELNTTDINLTFNGKTTTYHAADITPKTYNKKPCRIVSVDTFAKQMRDDIKVTVTKTGTTDLKYLEYKEAPVTEGLHYKIEDYFKAAEANSTNESLIDLVHKIDNYGKYAQIQFNNYNRESFDEADPIPEDYDDSRLTPYLVKNAGSATGLQYTSGSLELESDTGLRVYYKLTGTDAISTYTFKVDGTKVTPVKKGTQYYVSIKNIPARLMNKPHTVTVTDKAGNTLTTTYSGLSYPAAVLASDIAPESLKNLCRAIDLYAEAALAYFGE